MSFSPNFTTSQTAGIPESILFTDTSTGSDVLVTQRQIYLEKDDGTFLVPTGTVTDYIVWTGGSSPLTKLADDVLDKDYALLVTVKWLNTSNVVLYEKTYLLGFTLYNEQADYSTTQWASGNNKLLSDNNFWTEKSELRTAIDAGNQAIVLASDQRGSQNCYDIATAIRVNSQYLFNSNS